MRRRSEGRSCLRGTWTLRVLGAALLTAAASGNLLAITPRVPSAPELIAKLGGGDKQTRIDAALWLGHFRDSRDVAPALERALKDPDEAVRLCALWALCTIRSHQEPFFPIPGTAKIALDTGRHADYI